MKNGNIQQNLSDNSVVTVDDYQHIHLTESSGTKPKYTFPATNKVTSLVIAPDKRIIFGDNKGNISILDETLKIISKASHLHKITSLSIISLKGRSFLVSTDIYKNVRIAQYPKINKIESFLFFDRSSVVTAGLIECEVDSMYFQVSDNVDVYKFTLENDLLQADKLGSVKLGPNVAGEYIVAKLGTEFKLKAQM